MIENNTLDASRLARETELIPSCAEIPYQLIACLLATFVSAGLGAL